MLAALLCLGLANVSARATWNEVEDGVLWSARAEGVVATEIAPGTPAEAVGVRPGEPKGVVATLRFSPERGVVPDEPVNGSPQGA